MLKELTIQPDALKDADVSMIERPLITAIGEGSGASESG